MPGRNPEQRLDSAQFLRVHRNAIVNRDVREYGYRGFGIDYDQRLTAWIVAHYAVERRWPTLIDLRRR